MRADDEFDAMWSGISRSPFGRVYIDEMYWLARTVDEELTTIFQEVRPADVPGQEYIRVDRELHHRIIGCLLSSARLRALIREREADRRKSRGQREILPRRTAALRKLLEGIDLEPVLHGAVRNSLEHHDEYVDGLAIKAFRGAIQLPALVACDMVLSTRDLTNTFEVQGVVPSTSVTIRTYIADERVFTNCGRELRLEPLRDCCKAIRERIENNIPEYSKREPLGALLVLTKQSFNFGEGDGT